LLLSADFSLAQFRTLQNRGMQTVGHSANLKPAIEISKNSRKKLQISTIF
jgi:hypothetical protein